MGRALFLDGQPRPHIKGTGFQLSPNFGVPFYLCVHPLSQNYTKFDVVTPVGEGRLSWGQPRLTSQESRVLALTNFGVLLYLCLHPLTQNDQIRHGNTWGMHLHKCVASFVSDSRVSCIYICICIAAASECLNLCTFRQNSGLRRR